MCDDAVVVALLDQMIWKTRLWCECIPSGSCKKGWDADPGVFDEDVVDEVRDLDVH